MLLFIIFCVACSGVFSDDANECIAPGKVAQQADYYWRDYLGVIPHDAIEGGYTKTRNTTYIGHFPYDSAAAIFVGNINAGKREAVGAFGGKITRDKYILILCGGAKSRFEWKEIDVDELDLLRDYHLVKGGIYNNTILYIGRTNIDDQMKVGHVYPQSHSWKGLWVYKDNNTQRNIRNFEILVVPK